MTTITSPIILFINMLLTAEGDYSLSAYPYLTERIHEVELLYLDVNERMGFTLQPLNVVIAKRVEVQINQMPKGFEDYPEELPPEEITAVILDVLDTIERSLKDVQNFMNK